MRGVASAVRCFLGPVSAAGGVVEVGFEAVCFVDEFVYFVVEQVAQGDEADDGAVAAKHREAATGTVVSTLSGHNQHVNSVAFSPDGAQVFTGQRQKAQRE